MAIAENAPQVTRDLLALFVQQDNISSDTECRKGLSAIAELLVTS